MQPVTETLSRHAGFSTAAPESARLLPTYQQLLGWDMTDDRCALICIDAPRAESIRERLLDDEKAQEAAERGKALADPTRLTLAAALREGEELCVCDLSWIAGRAQNLVSHHLRMLRSYGMVRSRRDGKLVMYSLTAEGRSLLSAVLGEEAGIRA